MENNDLFMMENQPADLSKIELKDFAGVVWKSNYIYTISTEGKLCVFNEYRKVEKWMNIKVKKVFGLSIWGNNLLWNWSDGVIRLFNTDTLEHILTLPRPPPLGAANLTLGSKKSKPSASGEQKYADCVAVDMDDRNERIITVYSDRMILIWDLSTKEKVNVMRALFGKNSWLKI